MQPISYKRHRFPPDVIRLGIWLYLRRFRTSAMDRVACRIRCSGMNLSVPDFARLAGVNLTSPF